MDNEFNNNNTNPYENWNDGSNLGNNDPSAQNPRPDEGNKEFNIETPKENNNIIEPIIDTPNEAKNNRGLDFDGINSTQSSNQNTFESQNPNEPWLDEEAKPNTQNFVFGGEGVQNNIQPKAPKQPRKPLTPWQISFISSGVVLLVVLIIGWALFSTGVIFSSNSTGIGNGESSNSDIIAQAGSTLEQPNWEAVAKQVGNAVVSINVEVDNGTSAGSGAIISQDGLIFTNNHVISGAKKIQVTLLNGDIYPAKLVGTDPTTDVALIKLTKVPQNLTVVKFNTNTKPLIGQSVMAIGNPLGLNNTVTTGIISAIDRPVAASGDSETGQPIVTNGIQVDAAINKGNSGGPLFNGNGEVIGINSAIASTDTSGGSIGIGFAIPASLASDVIDQLKTNGSVVHAMVGVSIKDGEGSVNGVGRRGAEVVSITSNEAKSAGVKKGDVVVEIEGHAVIGVYSFQGFVHQYKPGASVKIVVIRDSKLVNITTKLIEMPNEDKTATPEYLPKDGTSSEQSQTDQQQIDPYDLFKDFFNR